MRADVVKGRLSRLAGKQCRHCPRKVKEGEVVLWAKLPNVEWGDDTFVVHVACMAAAVDAAPAGASPRDDDHRNQRRREKAAARRRATARLCDTHADELASIEEDELVVAALARV
jgi:hypothetical protein